MLRQLLVWDLIQDKLPVPVSARDYILHKPSDICGDILKLKKQLENWLLK